MTLVARGTAPTSVFGLLGTDENSATFALGWVLERCAFFRQRLLETVFGTAIGQPPATVTLQSHGDDGGFTDLELHVADELALILEAKRGWSLPTEQQLRKYHPRFAKRRARKQRILSVSAVDSVHARKQLPRHIDGVPVTHLSWRDLLRIAEAAHSGTTGFEDKLWLRQLIEHLREYVAVDRTTSNQAYIVSLGSEPMVRRKPTTWIDVVERDQCYFHPIRSGWPPEPPNYIGFRYRGRLQSVHHIDSFEVANDLSKVNSTWPKTNYDHFVYRLGPAMKPHTEVRTGKLYMNGRVWCAIDTLLSGEFATISAANAESKRRQKA